MEIDIRGFIQTLFSLKTHQIVPYKYPYCSQFDKLYKNSKKFISKRRNGFRALQTQSHDRIFNLIWSWRGRADGCWPSLNFKWWKQFNNMLCPRTLPKSSPFWWRQRNKPTHDHPARRNSWWHTPLHFTPDTQSPVKSSTADETSAHWLGWPQGTAEGLLLSNSLSPHPIELCLQLTSIPYSSEMPRPSELNQPTTSTTYTLPELWTVAQKHQNLAFHAHMQGNANITSCSVCGKHYEQVLDETAADHSYQTT